MKNLLFMKIINEVTTFPPRASFFFNKNCIKNHVLYEKVSLFITNHKLDSTISAAGAYFLNNRKMFLWKLIVLWKKNKSNNIMSTASVFQKQRQGTTHHARYEQPLFMKNLKRGNEISAADAF